ncbi:MAG: adenosylcobinamide-GDP ribazoletransferase [Halofilum sp. (in: g-proteobacteria)]
MRERLFGAAHDAGAAVVFLTRLPLPWHVPDFDARLGRSAPWFPLVGVLVGAIGALVWWIGITLWNPAIGALLAVAATVLATGAFHEDGLADSFDGLGGSAERERALAIMKDSRLGAYGAVALMLVLAGRVLALTALGGAAAAALVGGHALARCATLPLLRWLPYARADGGTGQPFAGGVSLPALSSAVIATFVLTWILWGGAALAAWAACAAVVLVFAGWCRRRLGGITGDTLGASNQLAELAVYLALAI